MRDDVTILTATVVATLRDGTVLDPINFRENTTRRRMNRFDKGELKMLRELTMRAAADNALKALFDKDMDPVSVLVKVEF